jgi:manganese transport protein
VSDIALHHSTLDLRTQRAAHRVLAGQRLGPRGWLPFIGPAVVASVAYVDPGNFATNIQGGASYGYQLLWVVVLANVSAMLFQGLSARLGIVTGQNLAELCRQHFPRPVVLAMWLISEVAAMATDLAEFVGASIGLSLLLHIPLLAGMVLTGIITYAILTLQSRGFRLLELVVSALVGVIALAYLGETLIAPINWGAVAVGAVVPRLSDAGAVTLAVGIVGATVMPHAIYLHSSLTQNRIRPQDEPARRRLIALSDREVLVALGVAGLVNMAMLAMAAAVFHDGVHQGISEIGEAYHTLTPLLGTAAASLFLCALLASGLSSSVVGTLAGQVIMQGFVGFAIPIWLRRLVTMAPAFLVIGLGANPTTALVLSQVVLSLVLPLPVIALLIFSRRPALMGAYTLRGRGLALGITATIVILALNLILLAQQAGIPGLG